MSKRSSRISPLNLLQRWAVEWNNIDIEGKDFFVKQGGQIIPLSAAESARWVKASQPVVEDFRKDLVSKGYKIAEIDGWLKYIDERIDYWEAQEKARKIPTSAPELVDILTFYNELQATLHPFRMECGHILQPIPYAIAGRSSFSKNTSLLTTIVPIPSISMPNLKLTRSPERPRRYGVIPQPTTTPHPNIKPVAMLRTFISNILERAISPAGKNP